MENVSTVYNVLQYQDPYSTVVDLFNSVIVDPEIEVSKRTFIDS
jgi:hypothetical protein